MGESLKQRFWHHTRGLFVRKLNMTPQDQLHSHSLPELSRFPSWWQLLMFGSESMRNLKWDYYKKMFLIYLVYATSCPKWVQHNANIICKLSTCCMEDTKIRRSQISKWELMRACCGFATGFSHSNINNECIQWSNVFVLWGVIVAFRWLQFYIWIETENLWWFPESQFNKSDRYEEIIPGI